MKLKLLIGFLLGIAFSIALVYLITDMYSTYMNWYNFGTFFMIFVIGVILIIISLCVIFAGFANQAMKITFGDADKHLSIKLKEKASMVWPQYILLLTSLVLCLWIPETLYKTIIDAVAVIGGGF